MGIDSTSNTYTLGELSSIGAQNNAREVAFGDGWTDHECTWGEFDARSNRAGNAFREYASQGDRIAFLSEGSTDHVTLWNGALKAGCVVSNLHTQGAPETLRYCIDELSPQVVVIGDAEREYEASADSFIGEQSDGQPDTSVDEGDIAAVIWTSGTTGNPKGWCFTNRGLMPSFAVWYSGGSPGELIVRAADQPVWVWNDTEKGQRISSMDGGIRVISDIRTRTVTSTSRDGKTSPSCPKE